MRWMRALPGFGLSVRPSALPRGPLRLALAAGLLLAGCGGSSPGNEPAPTPLQSRNAASARYAQLLGAGAPAVQVANVRQGSNTVLLRETLRAGTEVYTSPDGVALRFRAGLLTGTAGLGGDMQGSDTGQSAALIAAGQAGVADRFHSFLGGDYRLRPRSYKCVITPGAAQSIAIGTRAGALRQVQTRLVQEDCRSLDQSFSNLYWVGPAGRILQSRQWAGDTAGPLVIRLVLD